MHKRGKTSGQKAFSALVLSGGRIFKSGNSLAVRIPTLIAKRLHIEDGVEIQFGVDDDMLLIRKPPATSLDDLIDAITPKNLHRSTFENVLESERW